MKTPLDQVIEFTELLYLGSEDPSNLPAIHRDLGKLLVFLKEMRRPPEAPPREESEPLRNDYNG